MKKCPYCVEEIQDDAIKCKHCGEFLKREKKIITAELACPKCSKSYDTSWKVCLDCRIPLKATRELSSEEYIKNLPVGKYSCPKCHSKHTNCERQIGCAILIIIFISFGLGLLMIPFLPYHCTCLECEHKWKT